MKSQPKSINFINYVCNLEMFNFYRLEKDTRFSYFWTRYCKLIAVSIYFFLKLHLTKSKFYPSFYVSPSQIMHVIQVCL